MASSMTTSAVQAEVEVGSHMFKVLGYSFTKGIGVGKYICSDVFTIGGYNWVIKICPDGSTIEDKDFISLFLELKSDASDVKAQFTLTMLQQNGVPFDNYTFTTGVKIFKSNTDTYFKSWGYPKFAKRCEFDASACLKDDVFTIKCTVTVWKGTNLQATTSYGIVVPPSNSNQHFVHLLEKEDGADVTFVVKGDKFKAHRCVLAARSAVFNAELFGCMKEKWRKTITVEDIDAPVFKAMLFFIYSDSLPDFEENSNDNDGVKKDVILMAQHLLVAADRYDLERLKLMCEDFLWKTLNVNTVVSTLILAEQHHCNQLKAECLRFMRSPVNFKAVALTDEFDDLKTDFRSILKEI